MPVPVRRLRGRWGATAVIVLIGATATAVSGAVVPPPPVSAGSLLCRSVAVERGLDFRGAYGPTPSAGSPMAAMMLRNMGNGAAVADIDGSGRLSVLMLGQIGHANRLFRPEPRPDGTIRYEDVTEAAGLGDEAGSRVAAFADLDGDGHLDLVTVNDWDGEAAGSPSSVYRNRGDGTFEDVTDGSGFDPVGYLVGGLSLADYDRDGRLDLYISYWTMELGGDPSRPEVVRGLFPAHNRLYRNLGDFRFADVTREAGLGQLNADSFSTVFADFTADGWPDLYVAVDHRADLFYVNERGTFRQISREVGVEHVGNDMGVAVADLESDGWLDLYVTNITDPNGEFGNGRGNTMLVGEPGPDGRPVYADRAVELGVDDTGWGWGTAFTDLDLDGQLDLFAAQGMQEFIAQRSPELADGRARVFLGRGGRDLVPALDNGCDVPGDQRAVVPFDADRDGDPDLLVTQVAYHALLLENQSLDDPTRTVHGLTVDLSRAGAQAAGARVTVEVRGRRTTQVALYGGSYLAGMPLELYFGLGEAARADAVTVTWADGSRLDLGAVDGDRVVRVTPDGIAR